MGNQVSIIVPVYNAKDVLARCVDSILDQSYTFWELLLIDDGSPDKSGLLCDEYAQKDNRIKVFHTTNGGVSKARNFGISKAQHSWIAFVDADDTISTNYLEYMVNKVCGADLVFVGTQEINHNGAVYKEKLLKNPTERSLLEQYFNSGFARSVWGKLFRKNIIEHNQIYFDEHIKYGEDSDFTFHYLRYTEKIKYVNASLYQYYIPPFTHNKYHNSLNDILYAYQALKNRINILKTEKRLNCKIQLEKINTNFAWSYLCILYMPNHYNAAERRLKLKTIIDTVFPYQRLGLSNTVFGLLNFINPFHSIWITERYLSFYFHLKSTLIKN